MRGFREITGKRNGFAPRRARRSAGSSTRRARRARPGLAVATRAAFLDATTRATLSEVARLAPYMAERVSPDSCARRATEGPAFPLAIATGALTLAMLFAPPGALALAAALPLAVLFAGAVGLRLAACTASLSLDERGAEIADDRLPLYTVVIALYREARVAPQIARAIDRLD